jgi:hypothetical protein
MRTVLKHGLVAVLLLLASLAHASEQRYHLQIDDTYETSKGVRIILAHSAWYRFTLACQMSDRMGCSDADLGKTYVLVLDNKSGIQRSILVDSSDEQTSSIDFMVDVLRMDTK